MELYGSSRVVEGGELSIGECAASSLIQQFGSPLYVYDESFIREQMRKYRRPFDERRIPYQIAYACKALCTIGMCQIAAEEGLYLDVVSAGELHTALASGMDPQHIYMHGNNKTQAELELAVTCGIGMIVVDNFYEIELLREILETTGRTIDVMLRVAPGVDAHTHDFIATGRQDSKFGFDLASGQVENAVRQISTCPQMIFVGLHAHIGSQIFDVEGFRLAAERLATICVSLGHQFGVTISRLNLGGGLGIRYTSDDTPTPIETLVNSLIDTVQDAFAKQKLALPQLMLEPGRSIVAQAGTTLYRIGSRKEIPGVRTYVAVDGGMTDNPRLALYGAKYEAALANRMNDPVEELVSIAGKCCESGDMLVWDVQLPRANPGDILAITCTGAYNYSMASNYNRIPRLAAVLVHEGKARLLVRRETLDDLIRLDVPLTVS
ncbi:MAG: diaminopimelate decarboxylase [Firmicutes bacterium]|nr:diaminopimelate decarboxylase [Bacillota bacterium]